MLGISGVVVGVLNSYNRFSVFAIAPFFWNVAIIAVLVGLAPAFPEDKQIYAYAIGVRRRHGPAARRCSVWDLRNTPFWPTECASSTGSSPLVKQGPAS